MSNDIETKKNRLSDNPIMRAGLVLLVLFVGMIPLAIAAIPGLPLLEQVWVAFAVSGILTLLSLLVVGIFAESARRIQRFSLECLRAIRGDDDLDQNQDGNALPTAG